MLLAAHGTKAAFAEPGSQTSKEKPAQPPPQAPAAIMMRVWGREPGAVPRSNVYEDANVRITFARISGTQAIQVTTENIGKTKILKPATHLFSETDNKPGKVLLNQVKDNYGKWICP
jgi:hypothetical protein